ncbi:hypothetical protein [Nocardiopsis chromatogenes]|uniref:hypothetical protein n=1 Tax=Nocardiopsis chromatogenes TaxID=280239 RepID=UPI0023AA204A|nr:hypothetical protein [Nocardiopsis chromatogenes]
MLILGSLASLAANVAVAEPTVWSAVIHAWPSFALAGAFELLMREFRTAAKSVHTASAADGQGHLDEAHSQLGTQSSDKDVQV